MVKDFLKFIFVFLLLFNANKAFADVVPKEIIKEISSPILIGKSQLKFFGFEIYEIALWGEKSEFSYTQKFAIKINYKKNFDKESLVERSIKEMKRVNFLTEDEERFYRSELNRVFLGVKKGDSKTALYLPQNGVLLFHNSEFVGKISDQKLARRFVDIWLHEKSSYPEITKELIGKND